MKQTVEEAAHSFAESRSSGSLFPAYYLKLMELIYSVLVVKVLTMEENGTLMKKH